MVNADIARKMCRYVRVVVGGRSNVGEVASVSTVNPLILESKVGIHGRSRCESNKRLDELHVDKAGGFQASSLPPFYTSLEERIAKQRVGRYHPFVAQGVVWSSDESLFSRG
jgi:hypothetical protein